MTSPPSRREVESRLEEVVGGPEENALDEAPWLSSVPRELWADRLEAWRYFISGGESHPSLPADRGDQETDDAER